MARQSIAIILRGMYTARHDNSPHELFLDQFEDTGGTDWLYRYNAVGAAYRVTADEKDAFVAAYDRWQKRSIWIILPIYIGVCIFFFALPPFRDLHKTNPSLNALRTMGLYLLVIGMNIVNGRLAMRAPIHALTARTPVAPALSNTERRRVLLDRLPGSVVFGMGLLAAFVLLFLVLADPQWSDPLWLCLAGACVAACVWAAVQGTRKWAIARTSGTL